MLRKVWEGHPVNTAQVWAQNCLVAPEGRSKPFSFSSWPQKSSVIQDLIGNVLYNESREMSRRSVVIKKEMWCCRERTSLTWRTRITGKSRDIRCTILSSGLSNRTGKWYSQGKCKWNVHTSNWDGESLAFSCCRVGMVWLHCCPRRTSCLRLVWKLFTRKGFEERKNLRWFEFAILELLWD